jgi:hypothetical protein
MRVVVAHGAEKVILIQPRKSFFELRGRQRSGTAEISAAAEKVINPDPNPQLPKRPVTRITVRGKNKWKRFRKMGRNPVQDLLFNAGFSNEPDVALRQVPDSTVEQPARPAARAKSKIVPVDESRFYPAERCVPRNTSANDAAANNQKIKGIFRSILTKVVSR